MAFIKRRKKVRSDRKYLEERTRRFLKSYLEADEMRKPQFYRAVEDISKKCQAADIGLAQSDLDDAKIAVTACQAAMQMVLDRSGRLKKEDPVDNFVTDACATIAVACHRAAGAYLGEEEMEKLGTAAVHLLTMATSYTNAQE
jgi:CxxC motif-containing protein (DUF1111 family)